MKFYLIAFFLIFVAILPAQEDTVKVALTLSPEEQAMQDYNNGIEALKRNDFNTAADLFTKCIMVKLDFDKAFSNRAIAYTHLKRYNEALADINLAITNNPGNADYHFNKSLVYAGMNLPDSQHVELDNCLKINGSHADAAYFKGLLAYEAGSFDKAIGYYTIAINSREDFLNAWNDRASAKRAKSDYEGAIADYQKALSLDNTQVFIYNNLGSVYRLNKDFDKAIDTYNKALVLDRKYMLAILNRGAAAFESGNLDAAQRDFEDALGLDPKNSFAYNNLASIALKKKDYKKARDLATRAIELDGSNGAAFYNRGIARQMLREDDGCCADWKMAHQLGVDGARNFVNISCLD